MDDPRLTIAQSRAFCTMQSALSHRSSGSYLQTLPKQKQLHIHSSRLYSTYNTALLSSSSQCVVFSSGRKQLKKAKIMTDQQFCLVYLALGFCWGPFVVFFLRKQKERMGIRQDPIWAECLYGFLQAIAWPLGAMVLGILKILGLPIVARR